MTIHFVSLSSSASQCAKPPLPLRYFSNPKTANGVEALNPLRLLQKCVVPVLVHICQHNSVFSVKTKQERHHP